MIEDIQALRVGPDEVLIIKLPGDVEYEDSQIDELHGTLVKVGLGERSIIFIGDVEFGVAKQDSRRS